MARVHRRLTLLATAPRPPGCEKLAGEEHLYRIRQGDYRVVYQILDATREITILRIRHRKDAYR